MGNLLELKKVEATYDQSIILRGVDLEVPPNSVVALLGRNGVGKTTTLRTIMGLVNTTAGTIELEGKKLGRTKPESRARMGVGYVPQGRDIFPMLTVWENLKVSLSIYGKESANRLEEVYTLFPRPQRNASSQRRSPQWRPATTARHRTRLTDPPKDFGSR